MSEFLYTAYTYRDCDNPETYSTNDLQKFMDFIKEDFGKFMDFRVIQTDLNDLTHEHIYFRNEAARRLKRYEFGDSTGVGILNKYAIKIENLILGDS